MIWRPALPQYGIVQFVLGAYVKREWKWETVLMAFVHSTQTGFYNSIESGVLTVANRLYLLGLSGLFPYERKR